MKIVVQLNSESDLRYGENFMSGFAGYFLALMLPGVVGYVWLQSFWRQAHPAARIGYGYLLGAFMTALIIQMWGVAGLSYNFEQLVVLLLAFGLLGILIKRLFPQYGGSEVKGLWQSVGGLNLSWQRVLWWLLVVYLLIRFSGLFQEVVLRPLYPWDAWMNWAPKAKVWFGLEHWIPFFHASEWLEKSSNDTEFYTLGYLEAATYPPLVPLVQYWVALGLGEWRDNWINMPWVFCALALLLAFYGQLRMLGCNSLGSMIAVYLLLSIPYLNTHVALAGYAELWLAAFYAAAVMALVGWSVTRSRAQLCLILLMGVACIYTKKPGLVWAITLLPGVIIGLLPQKVSYKLLIAILVIIVFFIVAGGVHLDLPGDKVFMLTSKAIEIPYFGHYDFEYHEVGNYFISNILIRDSWHLLGWLLFFVIPVLVFSALSRPYLLGPVVTIGLSIVFISVLFFYTDFYEWAIDSTTINRAIMHVLPALYYVSIAALASFTDSIYLPKTVPAWRSPK